MKFVPGSASIYAIAQIFVFIVCMFILQFY